MGTFMEPVGYFGEKEQFNSRSGMSIYVNKDRINVNYRSSKMYTRNVQGFFIPETDLFTSNYPLANSIHPDSFIDYRDSECERIHDFLLHLAIECAGTNALSMTFEVKGDKEVYTLRDIAKYISAHIDFLHNH